MIPAALACALFMLAADPSAGDARVDALWNLHYPRYARACFPFEAGFVCLPGYDPRHPSSSGMTPAEAQRLLTTRYEQSVGGSMTRTLTRRPDDDEVAAYAAALPLLEVGYYGHVAAVRIDSILSEDQLLIKGLQLIDDDALEAQLDAERQRLSGEDRGDVKAYLDWKFAHRLAAAERQSDRTYKDEIRLVGFPTLELRERQTWTGVEGKGFDVAVVRMETVDDARRPRRRLVLVALDLLRNRRVTEPQFEEHLASRGLDRAGFVALVQEMHAKHKERDAIERQVFARLLAIDPAPASPPR